MASIRNKITYSLITFVLLAGISPMQAAHAATEVKVNPIDAGGSTTCALRAGNDVYCVGDDSFGQLGDGKTVNQSEPQFTGVRNAFKVSVGSTSACAIGSDQLGICWGDNSKGQLGKDAVGTGPRKIALSSKLIDISVGETFACAVTETGQVFCWGEFINNNSVKLFSSPTAISGLSGVSSISVGKTAVCVVSTGIYCFGPLVKSDEPVLVAQTANASAVAVGNDFGCGLVSSNVVCWGDNSQGQLGQGSTQQFNAPVAVTGISDAMSLSVGSQFACVLSSTNGTFCWGDNSSGQIATGTQDQTTRVPVAFGSAAAITSGAKHSCALLLDASIKCLGDNSKGQYGVVTSSVSPLSVASRTSIRDVSSGTDSTCVIDTNDTMSCWGSLIPELGSSAKFKSVSVGNVSACAINSDSKVVCWGSNSAGQLGDGTNKTSSTPVEVVGITNRKATHISAGYRHFCATTEDGLVYCWGDNSKDQIGYQGADSKTAQAVGGIGTAVDVAVGDYHSCALLSTKDVYCWGDNSKRQITSDPVAKTSPTAVAGVSNVKKVSASVGNTCFLLNDGSAKCLGDSSESQTSASIAGNFSDISVGNKTVCFVKSTTGTVTCLGSNNAAKLGRVGSKSATLVDISGTQAASISVGTDHVCVVTVATQLSCWGSNSSGQLASSFGFPSAFSTPSLSVIGKINVGESISLADFAKDYGTTVENSWYRSTELNGTFSKISNEAGGSLLLGPSDNGRFFKVQVTLHKWGTTSTAYRSAAVGPVAGQLRILISSTPTISGKAKVGTVLRMTAGRWESGVSLSVQWYRGSSPIKGATLNSYKLTTSDAGKQISVWVTGTKGSLPKLVAKSAKTTKVVR